MDLSLNRIQDEGCFALANAWPGNTCLSELRLHGNDITPVGKRAFGAALLSSDTNCLQYASWNEWALIPETTKFLRSGSTPVRGNTHQKRPKLQVADAMVLSNCFARTSNVIATPSHKRAPPSASSFRPSNYISAEAFVLHIGLQYWPLGRRWQNRGAAARWLH